MLDYQRWKNILVLMICLTSFYFSLPTLLPDIEQTAFGRYLPSDKVNLGLDLKGGASILIEVDVKQYQQEQEQHIMNQIYKLVREYTTSAPRSIDKSEYIVQLNSDLDEAIGHSIEEIISGGGDFTVENKELRIKFNDHASKSLCDRLMMQTMEIIRRRIDESGTKEIDLQRQGETYIQLQVPGVEDPSVIKKILGKTAKLSFSLVDNEATKAWRDKRSYSPGTRILESDFGPVAIKNKIELTGDMLENAQVKIENNRPGISIRFSNLGTKLFAELTKNNIGKQLSIVLDNKVLSAPVINEAIYGGDCFISGKFNIKSANELALLLRAGALPAQLKIVEEHTIGPSLGSDSIAAGQKAVLIGVFLVIVTMFLFYGIFGMIANFAMLINLFMLTSILALCDATLTLPGIAGMVLTLGMSVDANVLIFERIKEEMKLGRTPMASIESGYNLAIFTILDSNVTTIIAAMIMYFIGSGPIKGFAVTLCMGIACSMFTAITLTRIIIDLWYRKRRPKTLPL